MRALTVIDRNVEKAHAWLNDLAEELETEDTLPHHVRNLLENDE